MATNDENPSSLETRQNQLDVSSRAGTNKQKPMAKTVISLITRGKWNKRLRIDLGNVLCYVDGVKFFFLLLLCGGCAVEGRSLGLSIDYNGSMSSCRQRTVSRSKGGGFERPKTRPFRE